MTSYLVRILTHPRRGAGTTASVRIFRLVGKNGTAGPFEWMRDGFASGSTVETQIVTDRNLGKLSELEIGHDSVGDPGTGWLLNGVAIQEPLSLGGAQTWFPCGKWLGESDAQDGLSGPPRVTLVASSSSSSNQSASPANLPLSRALTAAFAIPEMSKLKQGKRGKITRREGWAGEDAYYISEDACSFGVSDGVSQWRESGVDAGLYARALVEGAAAQGGSMDAAFKNAKRMGVQGSATLALVKLNLIKSTCSVEALGDSRVVVVRGGNVVERTIEQEHAFGVPFQLSSCEGRDEPRDALTYEWPLERGDVVVAGTDGLFDNVAEEEIARVVSDLKTSPFDKAIGLCQLAFTISQRRSGETPYSRAANEALNLAFSGGKQDDITAVVSVVT